METITESEAIGQQPVGSKEETNCVINAPYYRLSDDGTIDLTDTPRETTSSPLDIVKLRRQIRDEELKDSKRISSTEVDLSARTLIGTYRMISSVDPTTITPTEARRLETLKERCAVRTLKYNERAIAFHCRKYEGERAEIAYNGGLLGFFKAFDRFDLSRTDVMFSTFANICIKGEMARTLRDETLQKKSYNRGVVEKLKFVEDLTSDGYSPEKVQEISGIDTQKLRDLEYASQNGSFATVEKYNENGEPIGELAATTNVEKETMDILIAAEIGNTISKLALNSRKEELVKEFFGFVKNKDGMFIPILGFKPATATVIAERMGISQSYASRLRDKLARLIIEEAEL